jgi:hypothetical protein
LDKEDLVENDVKEVVPEEDFEIEGDFEKKEI